MSDEKYRAEAARWLAQAWADLAAAAASSAAGSHEWACFQCQQAAENAMKALWMNSGNDPWGHSVLRLVENWPGAARHPEVRALDGTARLLDKLYMPTRYPNGLPELTPHEAYGADDYRAAAAAARAVLEAAGAIVENRRA